MMFNSDGEGLTECPTCGWRVYVAPPDPMASDQALLEHIRCAVIELEHGHVKAAMDRLEVIRVGVGLPNAKGE